MSGNTSGNTSNRALGTHPGTATQNKTSEQGWNTSGNTSEHIRPDVGTPGGVVRSTHPGGHPEVDPLDDLRRAYWGDPEPFAVDAHTPRADVVLDRLAALRPSWHRRAACRGVGPDVFYPPKGGSNREALELCGICSVREECLAEALADEALDWGIRGGMTAQARKARRRNERNRSATT